MKDLQEKRIDKDLKQLSEIKTEIIIKQKKTINGIIKIELEIPSSLSTYDKPIDALLNIEPNYPINPPKLFFLTKFTYPTLCDGRDLIEDIFQTPWKTKYNLVDIIEKIPPFIKGYLKALSEGNLILSGNYFLGEKYETSFLEHLPIYVAKVKERTKINGNNSDVNKIMTISDLYFCIYEVDKKNKNFAYLTFWSSIRALITIRRVMSENICRFFWKNKSMVKKLYELDIVTDKADEIVNLILEKMKSYGINYDISHRTLGPKEGKIPNCDIGLVEEQIEEYEKKIEEDNNTSLENIQFLMTLYDRAVEYYSATNNPRFELITKKIQNLLKNKNMEGFLDKEEAAIKKEESESKKADKNINEKVKEEEIPKVSSDKNIEKDIPKEEVKEVKKEEDIKEENKKEELLNEENKKEDIKEEINKEEIKQEEKKDDKKEEIKAEPIKEEKKEFMKDDKKEEIKKESIKEEEKKESVKEKKESNVITNEAPKDVEDKKEDIKENTNNVPIIQIEKEQSQKEEVKKEEPIASVNDLIKSDNSKEEEKKEEPIVKEDVVKPKEEEKKPEPIVEKEVLSKEEEKKPEKIENKPEEVKKEEKPKKKDDDELIDVGDDEEEDDEEA